jgi:hypothetical protein
MLADLLRPACSSGSALQSVTSLNSVMPRPRAISFVWVNLPSKIYHFAGRRIAFRGNHRKPLVRIKKAELTHGIRIPES